MAGFNLKQVCKQIRIAGKHNILWWRQNGYHFVSNHHWVIRQPEDEFPNEMLVELFSIFVRIPENDHAFRKCCGNVEMIKLPNTDHIYSTMKHATPGEITPFIRVSNSKNSNLYPNTRVILHEKRIIYVNDDYIRMVDYQVETPLCTGEHTAMFFMDGAFVVLPVRVNGPEKEQTMIRELMAKTMVDAAAAKFR